MARELPHFLEALKRDPYATRLLGRSAYFRYVRGDLPRGILWLLTSPSLLRALAKDAERFTEEERAELLAELAREGK